MTFAMKKASTMNCERHSSVQRQSAGICRLCNCTTCWPSQKISTPGQLNSDSQSLLDTNLLTDWMMLKIVCSCCLFLRRLSSAKSTAVFSSGLIPQDSVLVRSPALRIGQACNRNQFRVYLPLVGGPNSSVSFVRGLLQFQSRRSRGHRVPFSM